ncbi:MAG: cysteine synthase family protein [Clostridiales Family XIII bacterium]|jgi:cysteine synthase B|nr:cysteine synthase family protein [Clostridiales Family XIII bacterium]
MRILDCVGNTPLIELGRIAAAAPGVRLLAKAEFCNPSGSVKDRAAKAMILEGVRSGALSRGKTIIDATSGNTGIAYSMIGAALGFGVRLYMPRNTGAERKRTMLAYGAEIVETDPLEGSDGAFLAVRGAVEASPDSFFYPDQFNNPANPQAHFDTTGAEIWEQTGRRVTHFITGMGTSGTFVGVARRLKSENPAIRTIAVQPDMPFHGIEGTKHMGSTIRPGILDESLQDGVAPVATEAAYAMARRLAREEGVFVGVSSGGNVAAALALATGLPAGSVVVTVLCDSGSRYLSELFWDGIVCDGGGI